MTSYWSYTPAGFPIPGFLKEILRTRRQWHRFFRQLRRRWSTSKLSRIFLALEAAHRERAITTPAGLQRALDALIDPNYDFGGADAVYDEISSFGLVQRRERHCQALVAAMLSKVAAIDREIATKHLPSGRDANLRLIKMITQGGRSASREPCRRGFAN